MSMEQLGGGLESLSGELNKSKLEPDPKRTDWSAHRETLDGIEAIIETEILGALDAALAELEGVEGKEGEDPRARVRAVVADRLGDAAGLLLAAGRREQGMRLLQRAASIGAGGKESEMATIGLADPERFIAFVRAWWLVNHQLMDEARAVAGAVIQGAPAAMAESLRTVVNAPRPLSSPPGLFTLNGFGVSIYGDRDHSPNGTYVKTRFVTALFVPLCPIDAYRVADAEEGWYFLGKVPLAPAMVWWRRLLLIGVVVAVIGGMISSHYDSESYRLGQAIAAAREAEQEAGPEGRAGVIDQYESIVQQFPAAPSHDLSPVVEAFVRLSAEELPSPLTLEELPGARRLVARYQALPEVARSPACSGPMIALLERWAEDLGGDDEPRIQASLELLGHAEALAHGEDQKRVREQRHERGRMLAARMAEEWPLEAIRQYVALGEDPQALSAAGALIDELGEGPSVWFELGPTVGRWASLALSQPELAEIRERAVARVGAAHELEGDPERQALLAGTDEEALAAALQASPGDQEIAVTLANLRMGRGDAEGALRVMKELGPPGRLVMESQATLASLQAEAGQLPEADALLERVLASRLPAFETARRTYAEKSEAMSNRLIDNAQRGNLPAALEARMRTASESEQIKIFGEWLDEQLEADPELSRLREDYTAMAGVIDVALQAGMIKLRRAQGTSGEEREALLQGAERAFLAIATEGQGLPTYHLGLGQVYYRLGKEAEGERELGSLLDDDPPPVKLAVAGTYRDLGLVARACEIAEEVYEQGDPSVRERAAGFLAIAVSDLEERRTWLERAGNDPAVQTELLSLDADLLRKKGDYAAAAKKYEQVAKQWSERAATSAAAANNAAVALSAQHGCTGELEPLREAVELLDRARKLQPDSAVVAGNLADTLETVGVTELLEQSVRTRRLLLTEGEADTLLGSLNSGPLGAEIRGAIGDNASIRRMLELSRQEQVLGPRRASPYRRQLQWYARRRDAKALGELVEAVETVGIDLSQELSLLDGYLAGSYDDDELGRIGQRLRHFDERLAKVERMGHAPTLAALHATRGKLLVDEATITGKVETARAAADAFAEANELWPSLATDDDRSEALVFVALLEATSGSVALHDAYEEKHRLIGWFGLLPWLLEEDGDMLAALRARPELAQAAALRRGVDVEQLGTFDIVLAKLAQDQTLLAAARGVLERPGVRERLTIELRLTPRTEATELMMRVLEL